MEKYKQKSSLNKLLHNMEQVVVFGSPRADPLNHRSPKSIASRGDPQTSLEDRHPYESRKNSLGQVLQENSNEEYTDEKTQTLKTEEELLHMNLNEYQFNEESRRQKQEAVPPLESLGTQNENEDFQSSKGSHQQVSFLFGDQKRASV